MPEPADSRPGWKASLTTRFGGAAPPQAVAAVAEVVGGMAAAAANGQPLAAGLAQAAVATGIKLTVESAMHLAITALAASNGPLIEQFDGGPLPAQDLKDRTWAASFLMTAGGGAALPVAYSSAAANILGQNLSVTDVAASVLGGLVSAGVVSAGVLTLYHTDSGFRTQVDRQVELLRQGLQRSKLQIGEQIDSLRQGFMHTSAQLASTLGVTMPTPAMSPEPLRPPGLPV